MTVSIVGTRHCEAAKRRHWCGNPFLLTRLQTVPCALLPPCRRCHSRSCFATDRQWRGCGAERPPFSAPGSGGALRPPIFLFSACPKRKTAPRPVEERKGRLHAGFPLTSVEPVPRGCPVFLKTGCNRGIGCRLCFRAETLRLALHGAGGEVLHRVPIAPRGIQRGSADPLGRFN